MTLSDERAAIVLPAADCDAFCSRRPGPVDDLLGGPTWDEVFASAVTARTKTPGLPIP